jgi:cyclopropane fatty-acyl-phospholipid synthase-like methyltransferase
MSSKSQAVLEAETYYDSAPADAFYRAVWGGDDIHVGMYAAPDEDIATASRRTVTTMTDKLKTIGPDSRVIDLGAGFGGSARYLVDRFGCHVTCLNLSETQNAFNRELTEKAGMTDKIDVVYGSFEELSDPDESYDIVWSQDAFLHSGERLKVLDEIKRITKPGGELIFTDPMQADDCPDGVLDHILRRIHLETFGSVAFYRHELEKRGFSTVELDEMPMNLRTHYNRVREVLMERREEITKLSGADYVDGMIDGLKHWVDGADKGYLNWGILHFRKG